MSSEPAELPTAAGIIPPEPGDLSIADLVDRYRSLINDDNDDPLRNPIHVLANELSERILDGDLTGKSAALLVQQVNVESIKERARHQAHYLSPITPDENSALLRELVRELSLQADGKTRRSFDEFRVRVERELIGLVFTAHPTFLLPRDRRAVFADLVGHYGGLKTLDEAALRDILLALGTGPQGWVDGVTLEDEHKLSILALEHSQNAIRRFLTLLIEEVRDLYPDRWTELMPKPFTLASWVGYDLDGRSDIRWSDTFRARLLVQQQQLVRYLDAVRGILGNAATDDANGSSTVLKLLESRLEYARRVVDDDITALPADSQDTVAVQAFGKAINRDGDNRLTNVDELIALLSDALKVQPDSAVACQIAILRAEMTIYGLGMAHTHVRLNATQIMNAVRGELTDRIDVEKKSGRRRRAWAVNRLLDDVKPVNIHFGSIMTERTSAKRLFMLVAQMLKHIDRSAPVRFLIAECEEASTVLGALYFARLFGIDDVLDISPLFETDAALQRGDQLIAELLDNEHYVDYVRKRGRLCIQTGFSDAGRYLGQVAASLAIERLRIKIGRLLAARGFQDVDLVIFDTHGESIGRGSHPGSFAARLDHVFPPQNREYFKRLGIAVKQEVSFQGGDGYLFFATDDIAFATMTRLIEHGFRSIPGRSEAGTAVEKGARLPSLERESDDAFYRDTDYSLDFFIALADFNDRLAKDPHYAALLGLFGTNLIYPTGSRAVKRQHDKGGRTELVSVSQIRAIPHNAVLQQMGYMANSCGGIGGAIVRDQERFWEVYGNSDRCRQFMALAASAFSRSNLDAFLGYIAMVDPAMWLRQAVHGSAHAEAFEDLAQYFEQSERYTRVWPAIQALLHDALILRQCLAGQAATGAREQVDEVDQVLLAVTHALRLALIQAVFVLATRVPKFTSQPDVTMDDVRTQLFSLDIDSALAALKRAFPPEMQGKVSDDFGEASTYQSDIQHGYDYEHNQLFEPMGEFYDLIRQLSAALSHQIGAVG